MVEKTNGAADTLEALQARGLNMAMHWGREVEQQLPCISSTSSLWARGPCQLGVLRGQTVDRMIIGAEVLAAQGVCHFLQAQCKPGFSFNNTQKMDLAGNAFNAAVVTPVFAAMVARAPLGQVMSSAAP